MATGFSSRFGTAVKHSDKEPMDNIQYNSSDDGSPLRGDVRCNPLTKPMSGHSSNNTTDFLQRVTCYTTEATRAEKRAPTMQKKPMKKIFGSLSRNHSSWTSKRSTGKKWYSDSDEEEEEELTVKKMSVKNEVKSYQDEGRDSELDLHTAGSTVEPHERNSDESALIPAQQLRPEFQSTNGRPKRKSEL
ncbi:unnamed protein product [Peronospora destructor]|uniref:Uncharacterized protein n=1 Tax=Peronospora destructor TaxID=86335 RepID=A0AAV0T6L4_9STRA|nr:unnamed protein product [Peronospora destructor]